MKIYVLAKPKKKREYIDKTGPINYTVAVKEPAQQGKANQAIIESLAKYFDVLKSQIILISGQADKHKTFEVPDKLAEFEPPQKQSKLF